MLERLEIRIGWPPKALFPNSRPNRWEKAKAIQSYRSACGWAAIEAIRAAGGIPPRFKAATVQIVATLGHRRRKPDPDNLAAALKSAWDGLQDAGVYRNDSSLVHLPAVFRRDGQTDLIVVVREISTVSTAAGPSLMGEGEDAERHVCHDVD